jgi:hypothetical protein
VCSAVTVVRRVYHSGRRHTHVRPFQRALAPAARRAAASAAERGEQREREQHGAARSQHAGDDLEHAPGVATRRRASSGRRARRRRALRRRGSQVDVA